MRTERLFTYIGIAAIILLVFGLGGWYLFLRNQTNTVQSIDAARGLGSSTPSFFGSRGSTIGNLLANIGLGNQENAATPSRPPRLWHIHVTPVAGAAFLQGTTTPILRYVDRSSGHVFDANVETGAVVRRTNTLKPQTYEALIGGGDMIVTRSLAKDYATIETFAGMISTTTEEGYSQLAGKNLAPNILDIATLPYSKNVLYLARNPGGDTLLIESGYDGSSPKQRGSFAVGNWDLSWLHDGSIILSDKPASGVEGHAYRLSQTGRLNPIVGGLPGLTILPRATSSALLYSTDSGETVGLFIRPTATSSTVALPLKTTALKCVWNPSQGLEAFCAVPQATPTQFIDRWLRGEYHSSDVWWKIDGTAGNASALYTPSENALIDVANPVMDSKGSYIAFTNAFDTSLWVLRVSEE